MENAPPWIQFATEMEQRRENADLSARRLAQRAGVSPTTATRLATGKGPAPAKETVVKIARALSQFDHWPRSDALRAAGYDPDLVPDDLPDLPPSRIFDIWPHLSPQGQRWLEWGARLMVDPDAPYEIPSTGPDTTVRFQPAEQPTAPPAGEVRRTRQRRNV